MASSASPPVCDNPEYLQTLPKGHWRGRAERITHQREPLLQTNIDATNPWPRAACDLPRWCSQITPGPPKPPTFVHTLSSLGTPFPSFPPLPISSSAFKACVTVSCHSLPPHPPTLRAGRMDGSVPQDPFVIALTTSCPGL